MRLRAALVALLLVRGEDGRLAAVEGVGEGGADALSVVGDPLAELGLSDRLMQMADGLITDTDHTVVASVKGVRVDDGAGVGGRAPVVEEETVTMLEEDVQEADDDVMVDGRPHERLRIPVNTMGAQAPQYRLRETGGTVFEGFATNSLDDGGALSFLDEDDWIDSVDNSDNPDQLMVQAKAAVKSKAARPDIGLVADYDFNRVDVVPNPEDPEENGWLVDPKGGGISSAAKGEPLIDIGESCGRPVKIQEKYAKGATKRVGVFERGTGFALPDVRRLLPSGAQTTYTIIMRVQFANTSCSQRLINTNPGYKEGFFLCDSVRVFPLTGGSLMLNANTWYDITIATNEQRETFTLVDGTMMRAVKIDEQNWLKGVSLQSSYLTFFNDGSGGSECNVGGPTELAGEISRIKIYDRALSLNHIKEAMDMEGVYIQQYTYERHSYCMCEQFECKCDRVCSCSNQCNDGDLCAGKATRQISEGWGGASWKAVRGWGDANYWRGSCTHTSYAWEPWWRVDLGKEMTIHRVGVKNRYDCCGWRLHGMSIHFGMDETRWQDNPVVVKGANPSNHWWNFNVYYTGTAGMKGRYIWIVLPKKREYLTLCGVSAYWDAGFEKGPCARNSRHGAGSSHAVNMMGITHGSGDYVGDHVGVVNDALTGDTSPASTDGYSDQNDQYQTLAVNPRQMTWVWSARPNQNFATWMEGGVVVLGEDMLILMQYDHIRSVVAAEAGEENMANIKVWSVSLRVYSTDKSVNCSAVDLFAIGNRDWRADKVTWSSRPALASTPLTGAVWRSHQWVIVEEQTLADAVQSWINPLPVDPNATFGDQGKEGVAGVAMEETEKGNVEREGGLVSEGRGLAVTCGDGQHGMDGIAGLGNDAYSPRLVVKYTIQEMGIDT